MSHNAQDSAEKLQIVWTDAGHPDEGSLMTWLHGAFDVTMAAQVVTHVEQCAVCQSELATLRGYSAAVSRILGTLDRGAGDVMLQQNDDEKAPASFTARAQRKETLAAKQNEVSRTWWTRGVTRVAAAALLMIGASTWVLWRSPGAPLPTDRSRIEDTARELAVAPTPTSTPTPTRAPAPVAIAAPASPTVTAPVSDTAAAPARVVARAQNAAVAATSTATESVVASEGAPVVTTRSVLVRGTVRAPDARQLLAFAQVLVDTRARAISDSLGRYAMTVSGVNRGDSIRVAVRALGYAPASLTKVVDADTLTVDLTLAAQAVSLTAVAVTAVQDTRVQRSAAHFTVGVAAAAPGVAGGVARGVAGGVAKGRETELRGRVAEIAAARRDDGGNREQYDKIDDNPFLAVAGNPRSTFSVDVDRASYGNVRRFVNQDQLPPPDAVRIEELINYFPYDLPQPTGEAPVAITTETMAAPWQPKHRLVRIALQARRIATDALPPSNLVFLIDVSGSMSSPDKLPLVKESLRLLVNQLREQDRVALVVYAGAAGLVLPSTSGSEKALIASAIDRLEAGGSTAGGAGLELAYRTAKSSFMPQGNNRVILASDGDFNVGASSDAEMERLIESKREEGTYLTILGFGQGNYQDAKMEKLAKRGNGNYAYVDDIAEAKKVLVKEMGATLVTVANDVKLQVEFNPRAVRAYRLIGYEDRLLATEDFANDRKDAGDMGAGHSVTALYEVVPADVKGTVTLREQDALRYQVPKSEGPAPRASRNELMFVNLRYKTPGEGTSKLMSQPVVDRRDANSSADFRFAASVASFGMVLRNSEHKGSSTMAGVLEAAGSAKGADLGGYRTEFVALVERALRCQSERRAGCVAK